MPTEVLVPDIGDFSDVPIIEVHVNPPYAPSKKGGCQFAQDSNGMCHQFAEKDYSNNIGRATFDVINAGKVRTADMGGTSSSRLSPFAVRRDRSRDVLQAPRPRPSSPRPSSRASCKKSQVGGRWSGTLWNCGRGWNR